MMQTQARWSSRRPIFMQDPRRSAPCGASTSQSPSSPVGWRWPPGARCTVPIHSLCAVSRWSPQGFEERSKNELALPIRCQFSLSTGVQACIGEDRVSNLASKYVHLDIHGPSRILRRRTSKPTVVVRFPPLPLSFLSWTVSLQATQLGAMRPRDRPWVAVQMAVES